LFTILYAKLESSFQRRKFSTQVFHQSQLQMPNMAIKVMSDTNYLQVVCKHAKFEGDTNKYQCIYPWYG